MPLDCEHRFIFISVQKCSPEQIEASVRCRQCGRRVDITTTLNILLVCAIRQGLLEEIGMERHEDRLPSQPQA